MRQFGTVDIPPQAFIAGLKADKIRADSPRSKVRPPGATDLLYNSRRKNVSIASTRLIVCVEPIMDDVNVNLDSQAVEKPPRGEARI
jgi:hypothetical protein